MKFSLIFFVCGLILVNAHADESACKNVKRHVGFETFGQGEIFLFTDTKNPKKEKLKSVSFAYRGDSEGIPLPCLTMLEVSGYEKDEAAHSFDLKIRECAKNNNGFLNDIVGLAKSDSNKKQKLKSFGFSELYKGFLSKKLLKGFYDGGKLNSTSAAAINEVLGRGPCKLKDEVSAGGVLNVHEYFKCGDNVKNDAQLLTVMQQNYKEDCAVAYGSDAPGDMFFYSSADANSPKENIDSFKKCVAKFESKEIPKEHPNYTINTRNNRSEPYHNETSGFSTYNNECKLVAASEVSSNMKLIPLIKSLDEDYGEDASTCKDCQGVEIVGDKVKLIDRTIRDACASVSTQLNSIAENECNKDFSCSKISKCEIDNKEEWGDLGNINDYENLRKNFNTHINVNLIRPIDQMFTGISGGKALTSDSLPKLQDYVQQIKLCIGLEKSKALKQLSVSQPQAGSKFLAEAFEGIDKLYKVIAKAAENAESVKTKTPQALAALAEYKKTFKSLPSAEDEMKKHKLSDPKCDALSSLLSNEHICELTETNLTETGKKMSALFADFDSEKSKYEEYQTKVEEKSTESGLEGVRKYLELVANQEGKSTKENRLKAVEMVYLQEQAKNTIKKLGYPINDKTDCSDKSSIFDEDMLAKVLGKKGEKLNEDNLAADFGEVVTGNVASKEENVIDTEKEEMKSTIAQLQQDLARQSAMLSGGYQGMNQNASSMVDIFSQYRSSMDNALMTLSNSYNKSFDLFSSKYEALSNNALSNNLQSMNLFMQYSTMMKPATPYYGSQILP